MSNVQIYINNLTANYSSSFHFKIRIIVSSSPTKESVETQHPYKYEQGSSIINIYEQLDLKIVNPLTSESRLQILLEVYTKTGYKTAGVGVYSLSKGVMINVPIKIEILKCPLGKGYIEIQFLNLNINPTSIAPSKDQIIPLGRQMSKDRLSINSDNAVYTNIISQNNLSFITNLTNLANIEPINKNFQNNISPKNIIHLTDNNQQNNNKSIKNSPKQIKNIPNVKLNNVKYNKSPKSCKNSGNAKPITTFYNSKSPKSNSIKSNFDNINLNNNNEEIVKQKDIQIKELKTKIDYYTEENNELKGIINDLKKEKKNLNEEKNKQINEYKEKLQKAKNEKEDLEEQYMTLKENVNNLQNNVKDLDKRIIDIQNQGDKRIKELMQQNKNLDNIKKQLENENKIKEEKIILLDGKCKEIAANYQKKMAEISTNYSVEKNNNLLDYNEKMKSKEEEIAKLNIKIKSMEESMQSLNDKIELNNRNKENKEEITENMKKLLEQVASKDRQIFDLKKEVSELNNKIITEINDRKTHNMINDIAEKDLKNKINELQKVIKEKDNELDELKIKYENLQYNANKLQPKINYFEESISEQTIGNNQTLLKIQDLQKAYKEREEQLLKEKNEEIKQLKMKIKELERGSQDNNKSIKIKKYINEINKLKVLNANLEEDLGYYKDLNNKVVDYEKRITTFESENIRLQKILTEKNNEIDNMQKKHRKIEEEKKILEKQLVNSKGKLGDVLNELAEVETKCVYLEEKKRFKRRHNEEGVIWC
jgi:chromosome segregation ATPase